ncbi:MAG TPA: hypothetical protein VFY68_13705 [Nitrososphaeraceae archaeon]|nr:hypothetical protein [Nitrososphaeraceae archaeon]
MYQAEFELGTNGSPKEISIDGPMACNRGNDKKASKIIRKRSLIGDLSNNICAIDGK